MKAILTILFVLLTIPACASTAPSATTETSDEHKSENGQINVAGIGAHIELKGTPEAVRAMMAGLENEATYKAANCVKLSNNPTDETLEMVCTRADNALLGALNKHVRPGVIYTVSATSCVAPCKVMKCPPGTGTIKCCTTTAPYQACPTTKLK